MRLPRPSPGAEAGGVHANLLLSRWRRGVRWGLVALLAMHHLHAYIRTVSLHYFAPVTVKSTPGDVDDLFFVEVARRVEIIISIMNHIVLLGTKTWQHASHARQCNYLEGMWPRLRGIPLVSVLTLVRSANNSRGGMYMYLQTLWWRHRETWQQPQPQGCPPQGRS